MSRCVSAACFTACFGALVWFVAGCVPSPPPGSGSAPAAGNPSGYVQRISADQLDSWRGVHYEGLVIDVRGPEEWDGVHGHLDGAVLIPMGELQQRIPEIARFRSKPVLVYCKDGTRSLSAAQTLVSNGFRDVTSLDGGIAAYRQLYPVTP